MEEQLKNIIFNPIVIKIASIILGIIVIWLIINGLQRSLFLKIKGNDNRYRAKKVSNFIGYILVIVLITIVFSDKLGGLSVALGVTGAGIAFALQEVIASFAGWLAIMFGGFYKSGDRVQLGGIKGDVMDVGVLRTTIMETGQWVDGDLYNGRIVLVANSYVFKEPVFNYSGEFPFLWDEIKIPVKYGSDYEKAKELILKIGTELVGHHSDKSFERWKILQRTYLLEDAITEPIVTLIANDNWVEFTLRYVVNYRKRRSTKSELFSRILKEIENSNGDINFPSASLKIIEAPDLKVTLKRE